MSDPPSGGRATAQAVYNLLYTLPRRDYLTRPAQLPENGIYAFFQSGEVASCGGRTLDRVVRVGTHRVDDRFRGRISDHYGNSNNKNGSVFRMQLGAALMAKANPSDSRMADWLTHGRPTYPELEEQVSRLLREAFTFVCFRVDTEAERLLLESALITLFAQTPMGQPSNEWLGRHSASEGIRRSGLWNVRGLDSPPLTLAQFRRLEQLIKNT